MESSQFSYEAPGPSYESSNGGGPGPGPEASPRTTTGTTERSLVPGPGGIPAPTDHPSPPRPPRHRPWPDRRRRLLPHPSPRRIARMHRHRRRTEAEPVIRPTLPGAIRPTPGPSRRHTRRRPPRGWCGTPCIAGPGCGWWWSPRWWPRSLGGLIGAIVGANSQQTIILKYFPNKSALTRPQDVQEVLAKVEPAVVSIDSESTTDGGAAGGDFAESAGTGMILTSGGEVLTNNHVVAGADSVTRHLVRPDRGPVRPCRGDRPERRSGPGPDRPRLKPPHRRPRRLVADPGGRRGAGHRQRAGPGRRPDGDRGHRLRGEPVADRAERRRTDGEPDRPHPDRRRHQPGQLGRTSGQPGGTGGRDEHRGGLRHQRQRSHPEHRVRHHRRFGQAVVGQVAIGRGRRVTGASPSSTRRPTRPTWG